MLMMQLVQKLPQLVIENCRIVECTENCAQKTLVVLITAWTANVGIILHTARIHPKVRTNLRCVSLRNTKVVLTFRSGLFEGV